MKRTLFAVLTAIVITTMSGFATAKGGGIPCWSGVRDDPAWDECIDMCEEDRGAYCQTVFPRASKCNYSLHCIVDFWMKCTDGYIRTYYKLDTGYSPMCYEVPESDE